MNNVSVVNYRDCFSCRSCFLSCPKNAIEMIENSEGFFYPFVNEDACINCGLCEKHCPVNFIFEKPKFNDTYAMILKDDSSLQNSTSGGVFYGFAKKILEDGGVVFGAKLCDDFSVKHISISSVNNLKDLQGSKYVASDTRDTYYEVMNLLKKNTTVLYSGTPCQIAGVKAYLGKDYDNLYTVDLICHGTPSVKLFKLYIKWLEKKYKGTVIDYKFRNKEVSTNCGQNVIFHIKKNNKVKKIVLSGLRDPFMYSFMNRHIQRESCYKCKFMNINRISDCTIGDFWGIEKYHPDVDISKGVSVCIVNTVNGQKLFEKSKDFFDLVKSDINYACERNSHLYKIAEKTVQRANTYKSIERNFFNEKDFSHYNSVKFFLLMHVWSLLPKGLKKVIKGIAGKKNR